MNIQILGSGGGEGYPALFCNCRHCMAARQAGGKSIRSLSQTLVDGRLLIDLPADTSAHFRQLGRSLGEMEHLLITHVHGDHYCPGLLETRGTDFAPVLGVRQLHVYGNTDVERLFQGYYALFPIREEIRREIVFHTLAPFQSERIDGYQVTPLKANHAPEQTALNYIIDDGKSALLYLLDSGFSTEETLAFLGSYPRKFDCVVMDGTMGFSYYVYHMNFQQNMELKNRLMELGAADGETRFVVAHITHNHAPLHEEIEAHFQKSGIEIAYDGVAIDF